MVYVTRKEHFNAAHKIYVDEWSEEKNQEVFDKCANPNWHGHNFNIYVTVKGKVDPQTGFVVNLKHLSRLIIEKVADEVDHRNLNVDVDFMKGVQPSTENLAIKAWEQLEAEIEKLGCALHCVRIEETENNSVEYFGA